METKTGITILSIVLICLALLSFMGMLFAVFFLIALPEVMAASIQQSGMTMSYMYASLIYSTLCMIAMLTFAIGLFLFKEWARKGLIGYAITVASVGFIMLFVVYFLGMTSMLKFQIMGWIGSAFLHGLLIAYLVKEDTKKVFVK